MADKPSDKPTDRPGDRVTLSLSARVLINVEALNMAETVGNVSRHRKAPIVVPPKEDERDEERGKEYSLVYVPAISGESIAHHFQKIFVSLAKQRGLPVPRLEEQGYFLKYASEEVLENHYPGIKKELDEKMTELVNKIKNEVMAELDRRGESSGASEGVTRKEVINIVMAELEKVQSEKKKKKGSGAGEKPTEEDIEKAIQRAIDMIGARMCETEKVLVGRNAVADVAGFLFTGRDKPSVKRTSRIHFSYLIPALETVRKGVVAAQPQMHTRYSPQAREGEQALFYVEGSSALYTFSVVFVASDVGKLEYCIDESSSETQGTQGGSSQEEAKKEEEREKRVDQKEAETKENERKNRVEVALDALLVLLDSMTFGAKRARYLPHWQYDSIVAAVSKGPVDFVVSPASNPHYIQETVNRAKSIKGVFENISIFVYARNPDSVKHLQQEPGVTIYNTPTDALAAAANKVRELVKEKEKKGSQQSGQ